MVFAILVAQVFQAFVSFGALVGPVARLRAVRAVALTGFVVAHLGVGDAVVRIVPVVGSGCRRSGSEQQTQGGTDQCGFPKNRSEVGRKTFHGEPPRSLARAGVRDAS